MGLGELEQELEEDVLDELGTSQEGEPPEGQQIQSSSQLWDQEMESKEPGGDSEGVGEEKMDKLSKSRK